MNTTNDKALASLRGQLSEAALFEVPGPILDTIIARADRAIRGGVGRLREPDRIDPGFRD